MVIFQTSDIKEILYISIKYQYLHIFSSLRTLRWVLSGPSDLFLICQVRKCILFTFCCFCLPQYESTPEKIQLKHRHLSLAIKRQAKCSFKFFVISLSYFSHFITPSPNRLTVSLFFFLFQIYFEKSCQCLSVPFYIFLCYLLFSLCISFTKLSFFLYSSHLATIFFKYISSCFS